MTHPLEQEAAAAIDAATSLDTLETVRVTFLGKSGKITSQMKGLGALPAEERKSTGAALNQLKTTIANQLDDAKALLEQQQLNAKLQNETLDVTQPIRAQRQGGIHPITQAKEEIISIFGNMGFTVAEGPEIEDDFYNFTALNIPPEHPARQMHDTFYFPEDENGQQHVLRTHTSSVQIRTMQQGKPPFRIIAPGRVYRCDSDVTHSPMFHQIEGLYIDKGITMAHLKGCLTEFVSRFFGVEDLPVRFRPSFFPFTEPSAEMDIGYRKAKGNLTLGGDKATCDWLEVLGCGMVHPNVLRNVGVDPEEYQGFAFGLGIDRLCMLKYGISDIRSMFEGDTRWLHHYHF